MKFLKYFFWGVLGLMIQTHWPVCPVDFFVLTLAFSFPSLGLGPGLILALVLSIFYGAHSLTPWGAWWLPAGLTLVPLRFWKSYFLWPRWTQHAVGITLLLAGQWIWGAVWGGGFAGALRGLGQSLAGTLAVGIWIVPLIQRCWESMIARLPRPRSRMGELPLYWENMKTPRVSPERRRPFGLERV